MPRACCAAFRHVGLYHVAWEVDTLSELATVQECLVAAAALTGMGDHGSTKSLYARDPARRDILISVRTALVEF